MKLYLKNLFILVALVACFFAGWATRGVWTPAMEIQMLESANTGIKGELATISLGASDGLEPGSSVELYRGSERLGKALVAKRTSDQSVILLEGSSNSPAVVGNVARIRVIRPDSN